MPAIMEDYHWHVLPSKMYNTLMNTAAKIGTTVASKPIGQLLLDYTDKCLWTVEKSVQWYMQPGQKPYDGNADIHNEGTEPGAAVAAAASSGKPDDNAVESESESVRPLPWVLFFPVLMCLKVAKTSIDVWSYMLHKESMEPSSVVEFIKTRRNMLKEIKDHLKGNEEEKIDAPSNVNSHSCSNNEPEKQEIKEVQATPEKEIIVENKTENEAIAASSSEVVSTAVTPETVPLSICPDVKSSPMEENTESDTGNDSSSTLEGSITEKENTTEDAKEEDEDFHSVKSSSTYFSPDSSYSHQSVNEDTKVGDNLTNELENDTLAAAIEELRTLPIPDKTPLATPTSSVSSSTSSVKQIDSSRKRTSFSNFFQVRRKHT